MALRSNNRNLKVNSLSSFSGTLLFSRTSGKHKYTVPETNRISFALNSGKILCHLNH